MTTLKHEIAVTRFNEKTWNENIEWRKHYGWKGCAYCSRVPIKASVPFKTPIFVLEMNNDHNKIEGIGLIFNIEKLSKNEYINFKKFATKNIKEWYEKNKKDKRARQFQIYNEKAMGYNNYIYNSMFRIDSTDFSIKEKRIIYVLEHLVFKGSGHLKRGQGITIIPEWIKKNNVIHFVNEFKNMFKSRFNAL